jgi:hypothetical protein
LTPGLLSFHRLPAFRKGAEAVPGRTAHDSHSPGSAFLNGLYEVEELQSPGDEQGGLACLGGDFLDGVLATFLVEESAKPLRFLKREQVGPQQIFNELRFLRLCVVERRDADGNFADSGTLRDPEALCPGHDFIMSVDGPHKERQEDTLAADAFREFPEPSFIKRLAGIGA